MFAKKREQKLVQVP